MEVTGTGSDGFDCNPSLPSRVGREPNRPVLDQHREFVISVHVIASHAYVALWFVEADRRLPVGVIMFAMVERVVFLAV